jgi:ribonuclease BN (tRNA processing enzyme)
MNGQSMKLPRLSWRFSGLAYLPFHAASFLLFCALLPSVAAQSCGLRGVAFQVLGSGGPELQDKRGSSSYLVWEDGQAKALIDAGGGSALRFGESGAQMSQLDVLLFSHFHVDHSGDFSALIKSSWFEDRQAPLPIYGPVGNDFMPSLPNLFQIYSETNTVLIGTSVSYWSQEKTEATKCSHTTLRRVRLRSLYFTVAAWARLL